MPDIQLPGSLPTRAEVLLMQMIRMGNTLEFRTAVGNLTGLINIEDLGTLAATGSKVSVTTRDNVLKGFAYRDGNIVVFICAEKKFQASWSELIACAQAVGYSCYLTRVDPDPEQRPVPVTKRVIKPDPVYEVKPVKETGYYVIPPKQTKHQKPTFSRSVKYAGMVR